MSKQVERLGVEHVTQLRDAPRPRTQNPGTRARRAYFLLTCLLTTTCLQHAHVNSPVLALGRGSPRVDRRAPLRGVPGSCRAWVVRGRSGHWRPAQEQPTLEAASSSSRGSGSGWAPCGPGSRSPPGIAQIRPDPPRSAQIRPDPPRALRSAGARARALARVMRRCGHWS